MFFCNNSVNMLLCYRDQMQLALFHLVTEGKGFLNNLNYVSQCLKMAAWDHMLP